MFVFSLLPVELLVFVVVDDKLVVVVVVIGVVVFALSILSSMLEFLFDCK